MPGYDKLLESVGLKDSCSSCPGKGRVKHKDVIQCQKEVWRDVILHTQMLFKLLYDIPYISVFYNVVITHV